MVEYYSKQYRVDVRSIRYPGLISWVSDAGGGTTDYAVEIYHQAILTGNYTSFLSEKTALPMMYMDDAIKATVQIMQAPIEQIKIRSSYNLSAMSFTPEQIATEIILDNRVVIDLAVEKLLDAETIEGDNSYSSSWISGAAFLVEVSAKHLYCC